MRAIWLIVALLVAGGCTAVREESTGTTAAEPTALSLPARPRELRLDGVEPCSLLTEEQRADLGLERDAHAFVDDSALYGGSVPSCLLRRGLNRPATVGIGVVTTVGVERFTDEKLEADLLVTTIRGYPAIVATPRRAQDYCNVEIDVAPGQLVDILYGDVASPPPVAQVELCNEAVRVADAVVNSLTLL